MSIGALIVGLGQIAVGYDVGTSPDDHVYTHARALTLHPAFRLIGGVDPDESRRQRFEAECGRPAFADLESAVREDRPELVVIAVPTSMHAEALRQVLAHARPTTILCEKPLAYDLDDARCMLRLCAERGVRLFVNYMRRSDPGAIEVRRRIMAAGIAPPIKGVAWYSKGLLHNGSHIFNLLEYWLGEMIEAQAIDAGRMWDGHDPEPDLRVRFERGAVVFLAAREEHYSHYTVELVAGNGRLRYEWGGEQIHWQPAVADPNVEGYTVVASTIESISSGMNRYQWHVADRLASAMTGQAADLCDGAAAVRTLECLHGVLERDTRVRS